MQTYTVKKGDTLYGISNQFGVSVVDLKNLNNLKDNNLKIGQVLKISQNSGTNPDSTINYIVKKGDSLYSIARVYKTTVQEIQELNNLKSNALSIGQELQIPENYVNDASENLPTYINYTVKKGDSLYSIAKKHGITTDTIIKDNALKNNLLSIGQNLKIRTKKESIVEECFGNESSDKNIEYIVKKGDSLYLIAKKYNTDVSTIMKNNNLKSSNLSIGQILKI